MHIQGRFILIQRTGKINRDEEEKFVMRFCNYPSGIVEACDDFVLLANTTVLQRLTSTENFYIMMHIGKLKLDM